MDANQILAPRPYKNVLACILYKMQGKTQIFEQTMKNDTCSSPVLRFEN